MQQIQAATPSRYWEVLVLSFEEFANSRGASLTRLAFLLCGDRDLADDLSPRVVQHPGADRMACGVVAVEQALR